MKETTPKVRLIAEPKIRWDQVEDYLGTVTATAENGSEVSGLAWLDRVAPTTPTDLLPPGISSVTREGVTVSRGRSQIATDAELLVEYAGRRCYDDQTEILTEHGWIPGMKLTDDTAVATLTREGTVKWEIPLAYYEYDYSGPLLSCSQRNLDLAVTPEHRMWVQKMHVGGGFGDWHFATAETMADKGAWRMVT